MYIVSFVFIPVIADVLSFQNFFKTWLLDGSTDQEHLRITLPSAFTQDSEGEICEKLMEITSDRFCWLSLR